MPARCAPPAASAAEGHRRCVSVAAAAQHASSRFTHCSRQQAFTAVPRAFPAGNAHRWGCVMCVSVQTSAETMPGGWCPLPLLLHQFPNTLVLVLPCRPRRRGGMLQALRRCCQPTPHRCRPAHLPAAFCWCSQRRYARVWVMLIHAPDTLRQGWGFVQPHAHTLRHAGFVPCSIAYCVSIVQALMVRLGLGDAHTCTSHIGAMGGPLFLRTCTPQVMQVFCPCICVASEHGLLRETCAHTNLHVHDVPAQAGALCWTLASSTGQHGLINTAM